LPALISFVLFATEGFAQGIVINGGGFGHGRSGRSFTLSLGNPYGYGYGYGSGYGPSPYYSSFGGSRVTVIYSSPQIVAIPIVLSPPFGDLSNVAPPDTSNRRIPERRRDLAEDVLPAPVPQRQAAPARPVEPDNRDRPRPAAAPELPPPVQAPAKLPEPPPAPALPDNATLIDRGRAAFAAGEFGRAADAFRRAAEADANDALPSFLMIETLLALGKYSAASEAARAAVERFPRWTELKVRPVDLYGAQSADYAADLKRLADTLAAHPDDPVLLFLSAHFQWFDGNKDAARALFRRILPTYPFAERFLRPTVPTVL
jgi:hypothetical protein